MTDQSFDSLDSLQIAGERVAKREQTTKVRVIIFMSLACLVILVGSTYFSFYAIQQRSKAEAEARFAESQVVQIRRSTPIVAVSRDKKRSISKSGWLVNERGIPFRQIAPSAVASALFSPDGQIAFARMEIGTAVVVDSQTGQPLAHDALSGIGHIYSATFTRDSKSILITSSDGVFRGQFPGLVTHVHIDTKSPILFAALSPDDSAFIVGTQDGSISVSHNRGQTFDKPISTVPYKADAVVFSTAFSTDITSFLLIYTDGEGLSIDLRNGEILSRYYGLSVYTR